MTDTVTMTMLCAVSRHSACEDRFLFTTGHCQCSCHVEAREHRTAQQGPLLLVLPATFHPLRSYLVRRKTQELHDLVGCSRDRLEAVVTEERWTLLADVDRDDKALPPNGYARRLLDVFGIGRARYLGGTCVIAGGGLSDALSDTPHDIITAARDLALLDRSGVTA